ncbi:MAG: D-alanine--D-alanine ligase [Actinobacteria bacterium]|nr:D-alanine--D-alanine ligase [Actinomycetota bacterium]
MGGKSAEKEISLMTGEQIFNALAKNGHNAVKVNLDENAWEKIKKENVDLVFIALHGRWGEDGTVQGMLDIMDIPYTGSGILASALGMNKLIAKKLFSYENINTPLFLAISKKDYKDENKLCLFFEEAKEKLGSPFVVKPVSEGSAIGINIVNNKGEFLEAAKKAFDFDNHILLEQFIKGKEVTVGILGNDDPVDFPVLEIVPKKDFYDYEAKYSPGGSEHIVPARISGSQQEKCRDFALRAHNALGCRVFSRVDLIVSEEGVYVLEVNTIPGMTEFSLYPEAAKAMGIEFSDLIERIIELSLQERKTGTKTPSLKN